MANYSRLVLWTAVVSAITVATILATLWSAIQAGPSALPTFADDARWSAHLALQVESLVDQLDTADARLGGWDVGLRRRGGANLTTYVQDSIAAPTRIQILAAESTLDELQDSMTRRA